MYTSIYSSDVPLIIEQLASTHNMQRLKSIGMHCGCEYANFPFYTNSRDKYSRFTHSLGVASIVWNFTKDIKQSVAGLLHDISTPVFAHSIDFMNNDYISQESTEIQTKKIIENSSDIMKILNDNNISIDDVFDYHIYPIADNDTPMLSSDRLEYTLGNAHIVHGYGISEITEIYNNISVVINENGVEELGFNSMDKAVLFTEIAMLNSKWFISDEDRFCMQYLADLMRFAIDQNVVTYDDLLTTEENVLEKLNNNTETHEQWENYKHFSDVASTQTKPTDMYSVNISAKMRYINPLVLIGNTPKRILDVDSNLQKDANEFLLFNFNRWLFAK